MSSRVTCRAVPVPSSSSASHARSRSRSSSASTSGPSPSSSPHSLSSRLSALSALSLSTSPPPKLDRETMMLLERFVKQKEEEEERFRELAVRARERSVRESEKEREVVRLREAKEAELEAAETEAREKVQAEAANEKKKEKQRARQEAREALEVLGEAEALADLERLAGLLPGELGGMVDGECAGEGAGEGERDEGKAAATTKKGIRVVGVDASTNNLLELRKQRSIKAGERVIMSPGEFRTAFGESWQLSQFWYSDAFSSQLSTSLHELLASIGRKARIAFLSCPTAYVAFEYARQARRARHNPEEEDCSSESYLLEYDTRFELLAGERYVRYDLEEPESVPETLVGSVDVAVVDPPFLNEITNRRMATTVHKLLRPCSSRSPRGGVLLITGESISEVARELYDPYETGKRLARTALSVEHAGGLANEFGAWASWEGAEVFGGV